MIQPKLASTKKTKNTELQTSSSVSWLWNNKRSSKFHHSWAFIENTKTKGNVCVIFVCVLEFQKQYFEIMQIV
jgi:hypothetical protein